MKLEIKYHNYDTTNMINEYNAIDTVVMSYCYPPMSITTQIDALFEGKKILYTFGSVTPGDE